MNNKIFDYFTGLFPVIVFIQFSLLSCNKNDEPENIVTSNLTATDSANIEVSNWIYDWMKDIYYWNALIPSKIDISEKTDPEAYFYKLLSVEDKWSFIANYAELSSELSGEYTSMGYYPYFALLNNGKVIIIVLFVYPDSPAKKAGLKRGDIILTINGEYMDTVNYYDLYAQGSYIAELGTYKSGAIYKSGNSVTLNAASFEADPLIFDTIINIADKKIGYAVYTEFITGNNNKYLAGIDSVFKAFKDSCITDLIIDLRYNPGGEITAAGYIASSIAPENVVKASNTFVQFKYNNIIQNYFEFAEGANSENLVYQFPGSRYNLNLNKVYFLTFYYTASASELLITGLEPYMDVVQIGEYTYGKYVGGWLIYDEHIPPRHNWAMLPIIFKYQNAVGYTDFKDGLVPDYLIYDQLLPAEAFGSLDDPMLATAVEKITGKSLKSTQTSAGMEEFKFHKFKHMTERQYLIMPHTMNWFENLKKSLH